MQMRGTLKNNHHQRRLAYLQQFHMNIKYRKGNINHVVDYISRPLFVAVTTVFNS
jgi:hypothetical protein